MRRRSTQLVPLDILVSSMSHEQFRSGVLKLFLALFVTFPAVLSSGAEAADALQRGFQTPPGSARPRVGLDETGTGTLESIRRDLDWMKRIGIGAASLNVISESAPQANRLRFMSREWRTMFGTAASWADELGIELSTNSSPGWSETGGPWVRPNQAMKKLVWSETIVEGGHRFSGHLAAPPKTTGPFQSIPTPKSAFSYLPESAAPEFYADAAVIAYPLAHVDPAPRLIAITSSQGPLDPSLLSDAKFKESVALRFVDRNAWVQIEYSEPQTMRSATLGTSSPADFVSAILRAPIVGSLEAQEPSGDWEFVADLSMGGAPQATVSFKPVTARVFRVLLKQPEPMLPALLQTNLAMPPGAESPALANFLKQSEVFSLSEFSLKPYGQVNDYERKAGFTTADDYYALATPAEIGDDAVPAARIVDLSTRMKPDGTLDWSPPPGTWVVLRLGYSLTGKSNHPAPPEATGLEVDKLNRGHVRDYINAYLDLYSEFLSPKLMGSGGLRAIFADSIVVGPQNWTDDILAQFRRLRGYDPMHWLPTLAGVIVESPEASDKFLWDFRRTIAALLAEAHYDELAAAVHTRGIKIYGEALELRRPMLGDDMEMRRAMDMPTGAMWTFPLEKGPYAPYVADDRGAASVAHLYGHSMVGAESFTTITAPHAYAPRELKVIADLAFALGINRLISFGGLRSDETWAEQAAPFVTYLSRSSFLLQQGRFAADVAYFYGEEAPLTVLQEERRLDDVPKAYGFDFVNADALVNLLRVRDGYLVAMSGARYRALQLGGASQQMTLPVLRKIQDFVRDGGILIGAAPTKSPSLADNQKKFATVRDELWDRAGNGKSLGRGRVYARGEIDQILAAAGVAADLAYTDAHADAELLFVHRTVPEGEIYFLNNRKNRWEDTEISFRVAGKTPELWYADKGTTESVSFHIEHGRTFVPLKLEPYGAVFVVFRKPAVSTSLELESPVVRTLGEINGPWTVRFQDNRGAPDQITLSRLTSWAESSDPGVKYFSGTATYSKMIETPQEWLQSGERIYLDLGDVREIAEVSLNGKCLGIIWKPPYTIDITESLKSGRNNLEIRVTNLWVNRLIGDQQPGAKVKYAPAGAPLYRPDAPLLQSGLLGPLAVQLRSGGETVSSAHAERN